MHAKRVNASLIELLPQGTITSVEVAKMARDAHGLGRARNWLLDGSNAAFDRDALSVIPQALEWSRKADGLQRLVLVIPQAIGRLAARGLLQYSPVTVTVVESRADANRALGV